jgi:hypothetical protein
MTSSVSGARVLQQAAVAHFVAHFVRINKIICDSCYDAREYSSASSVVII